MLTSVERLLAPTDALIALVDKKRTEARRRFQAGRAVEKETARALVRHFTRRAALLGGGTSVLGQLTALPALATFAGGALVEMTLLLKLEVEMALTLSSLMGFDIRDDAQRQFAFLMASVATYDTQSGKNFWVDVIQTEAEAVWNYTPRRVGRAILSAVGMLALLRLGGRFMRLLPFVGPLVGTAVNASLTRRVGERCLADLAARRRLLARPSKTPTRATPRMRRAGRNVPPSPLRGAEE